MTTNAFSGELRQYVVPQITSPCVFWWTYRYSPVGAAANLVVPTHVQGSGRRYRDGAGTHASAELVKHCKRRGEDVVRREEDIIAWEETIHVYVRREVVIRDNTESAHEEIKCYNIVRRNNTSIQEKRTRWHTDKRRMTQTRKSIKIRRTNLGRE